MKLAAVLFFISGLYVCGCANDPMDNVPRVMVITTEQMLNEITDMAKVNPDYAFLIDVVNKGIENGNLYDYAFLTLKGLGRENLKEYIYDTHALCLNVHGHSPEILAVYINALNEDNVFSDGQLVFFYQVASLFRRTLIRRIVE